jgi:hypothetical protein
MRIKNIFQYITVIILSMITISCSKDNGVQPNPPEEPFIVDSNVFEWKEDTIWSSRLDKIYVVDTNDIFIEGYPHGIRIKSGIKSRINYNDNDFLSNCINGTNENNVYFGGAPYWNNISLKSKLKKWNGTTVEDIPLPDDSSRGIHFLLPIADNDVWALSEFNIMYHITGTKVKTYKFMNGFRCVTIFMDNSGNLYATLDQPYGGIGQKYIRIIYKYDNSPDKWNMINVDSAGYDFGIMEVCIADKKIIGKSPTELCYFTESGWIPIHALGPQYHLVRGAGNSISNMVLLLYDETVNSALVIFYFDGNIFYRQPPECSERWDTDYFGHKYNKFYYITLTEDLYSIFHTLTLKNNFSKNLNLKK